MCCRFDDYNTEPDYDIGSNTVTTVAESVLSRLDDYNTEPDYDIGSNTPVTTTVAESVLSFECSRRTTASVATHLPACRRPDAKRLSHWPTGRLPRGTPLTRKASRNLELGQNASAKVGAAGSHTRSQSVGENRAWPGDAESCGTI